MGRADLVRRAMAKKKHSVMEEERHNFIHGIVDENLSSGETVAWIMKLRDAGIKTLQLDDVTLRRRIHKNNTGRRDAKGEAANYAAILRARLKNMSASKTGETK